MDTPTSRLLARLRERLTFQLSVDTETIAHGLTVAAAGVAAGIDIVEMGTPLIKFEGATRVIPAFRERFPETLLLADLKTMDGGGDEARIAFSGGADIVDFLALAGAPTARAICSTRDTFRDTEPERARLVFADLLVPHQGPDAVAVARQMLDAGVDGVVIHLQSDARTANPDLRAGYLLDVVRAVRDAVGERTLVQAVGGLTIEQARTLAREGVRALVISANLGVAADPSVGLHLPPGELRQRIADFIAQVGD